jgi:hypothetical protein
MNRLIASLAALAFSATAAFAGNGSSSKAPLYTSSVDANGNTVSRSLTCTTTQPPVVTGTVGMLIAANSARRALRWMNVGASDITVAPGTTPPAAGQGMVYQASGLGKQGGSESFVEPTIASNAFAFSASSSATIIVWECQ